MSHYEKTLQVYNELKHLPTGYHKQRGRQVWVEQINDKVKRYIVGLVITIDETAGVGLHSEIHSDERLTEFLRPAEDIKTLEDFYEYLKHLTLENLKRTDITGKWAVYRQGSPIRLMYTIYHKGNIVLTLSKNYHGTFRAELKNPNYNIDKIIKKCQRN